MKMKKVTLNRNGQTHARAREVSDLKATPSKDKHMSDLTEIVQTVAILGEGVTISRELATAARNALGITTVDGKEFKEGK